MKKGTRAQTTQQHKTQKPQTGLPNHKLIIMKYSKCNGQFLWGLIYQTPLEEAYV